MLVAASLAYLIGEAAFNTELLRAIVLPVHERVSRIELLEFIGKLLSGVGLWLVLLRLLTALRGRTAFIVSMSLLGASLYAMWNFQIWLVTHLVDHSTGSDRRAAVILAQATDAVSDGVVRSRDLGFGGGAATPESAVTLSLFPLLAARNGMESEIAAQLPTVLRAKFVLHCSVVQRETGEQCDCAATLVRLNAFRERGEITVPENAYLYTCEYRPQLRQIERDLQGAQKKREELLGKLEERCSRYKKNSLPCQRAQQQAIRRSSSHDPKQSDLASRIQLALRDSVKCDESGQTCWTEEIAPKDFKERVTDPVIRNVLDQALAISRAAPGEFELGAKYYESGAKAYRAMVVPPLALGLSLLFSLINATMLIVGAAFAIWERSRGEAIPLGVRIVGQAVCLSCVLILVAETENPFVEEGSALARVDAGRLTPLDAVVTRGLLWVVRVEPILFRTTVPVREFVERQVHLTQAP